MELVTIPGASQRLRVPRSLSTAEFQKLLAAFDSSSPTAKHLMLESNKSSSSHGGSANLRNGRATSLAVNPAVCRRMMKHT
jgi:hypothetical protein